jgi:hypothetical protein
LSDLSLDVIRPQAVEQNLSYAIFQYFSSEGVFLN